MKKLNKSTITILVIIIGITIYMYPKSFKHTYENVQVYENGNKVKKVYLKLDAKVHKDRFVWQRLKFSEVLHGKVTIENQDYYLDPMDLYEFPDENGNHTDNDRYESHLTTTKNDTRNEEYILQVTHDKSKLYITNYANYLKEFIYPFESDEDYQKVINRMNEPIYYN